MNILRNFVMRVVALPTARLKEFILPARAESSLAEEQLASKIELTSEKQHFLTFFSLG